MPPAPVDKFEPPSWAGPATSPCELRVKPVGGGGGGGDSPGATTISLEAKSFYTLGRNQGSCDVHLDHPSASRLHAALVHHTNGRLYVIDLGATHGTTAYGKKLDKHKPVHLVDGARLRFGAAPWEYTVSTADKGGDSKRKGADGSAGGARDAKKARSGGGGDAEAGEGETVRCLHLLVKHKGSRRPSSHKEQHITRTQEEAEQMVLKFRHEIVRAGAAGGETSLVEAFEAVARRESHCSSGRRGGDLGHFARGKMQPPFEHAAFELKVGEVSDAVFSDSGVHIIMRLE